MPGRQPPLERRKLLLHFLKRPHLPNLVLPAAARAPSALLPLVNVPAHRLHRNNLLAGYDAHDSFHKDDECRHGWYTVLPIGVLWLRI